MNPDIEQILLAQAAMEAEQGPRLSDAIAVGAGGGAALGALVGAVPHELGKIYSHYASPAPQITAGLAKTNPMARVGSQARGLYQNAGKVLKPGTRMAGGLIGAVLGGGLGAALQQEAINEPGGAGALLARIQSQGGMNPGDQAELEQVLRQAYSEQGIPW